MDEHPTENSRTQIRPSEPLRHSEQVRRRAGMSPDELLASIPGPRERLVPQRIIASGGMGSIELTSDRALLRSVVRKVLRQEARGEALAVHGLVREAQIMAQLNHPNVVPVHELGVDERDGPYFAMQLVEGQTLTDLVRRHHEQGCDEEELISLLEIVVKACDALAFAHDRGVLHCDIKPDNVMVGDFGEVYLMDWGIARIRRGGDVDEATAEAGTDVTSFTTATAGMVTGTLRYSPPEQVKGETDRIDERTDVFSMGALLYCVLTGEPPHSGRSPKELYDVAAACDPELLRQGLARGTGPPALKEVALKAMSAEPAARFQSAEEFRAAIVRFVRGGGSFPRVRIPRGQHVMREGEEADAAYLMVSGECGVYTQLDGGMEDLRRIGPGDLFGEMGILVSGKRTASVVVVEDAELVKITREALESELDAMKPWIRSLVRTLANRFRDSEKRWLDSRRSLSAVELARQVLMAARTWGAAEEDGSLRVAQAVVVGGVSSLADSLGDWKRLLGDYQEIRIENEDVLVRDPNALAERLRPALPA